MSTYNIQQEIDPETAPAKRCVVCGHRLNSGNHNIGRCFCCQEKQAILGTTDISQDVILYCGDVLRAVCEEYGLELGSLRGTWGSQRVVEARQVAIFLLRRTTTLSKHEIGRAIYPNYNKSKSIIDYTVRAVEKHMKKDPFLSERIRRIQDALEDALTDDEC